MLLGYGSKPNIAETCINEKMFECYLKNTTQLTTTYEMLLPNHQQKSKHIDKPFAAQDVLKKYQRNVVATAVRACDSSKRSECVKAAKAGLSVWGQSEGL